MKIYLGSDHAGYELKEKIKTWLKEWGYEIEDVGAHELNPQDDYPDFIKPVAQAVSHNPNENKGIILGSSGQGEAIVANRRKGVRAVVLYSDNMDIVRLSREHNNANILSLGARFVEDEQVKKMLRVWIEHPFSEDERHIRRIKKIDE